MHKVVHRNFLNTSSILKTVKFGLSFPNEHGLVAIWASTLLFGITMGIVDGARTASIFYWDIFHAILFSSAIILNYENIKNFVNSKFKEYRIFPLFILFSFSIGLLLYHLTIYSLIFYILLAVAVGFWGVIAYHHKKQSYVEIVLGSLALSLQFPIIYHTIYHVINLNHFLYLLAIWWIYVGVILVIILNVGCYRGKIAHHYPIIIWLLFLLSFLPIFLLNYIEKIALILLIEPTVRAFRQYNGKYTMRDMRKSIKKIGWEMVIAIFTFTILIVLFAVFKIRITVVL